MKLTTYKIHHKVRGSLWEVGKTQMAIVAQMENEMIELHAKARSEKSKWPDFDSLDKHFQKQKLKIHSQTRQATIQRFLANAESTTTKRGEGDNEAKYPHKVKKHSTVVWKGQFLQKRDNHLVLPLGYSKKNCIKYRITNWPIGQIVEVRWTWTHLELVVKEIAEYEDNSQLKGIAALDPGLCNIGAITNGVETQIVNGRSMRSVKQFGAKYRAKLSKLQSKCSFGSLRGKTLQTKKNRTKGRRENHSHEFYHKAANSFIKFCVETGSGLLVVGDISLINQNKKKKSSKRNNQEMGSLEFGRLFNYLTYKAALYGIRVIKINEAYTTKTCPVCGHLNKPKGRTYKCRECKFIGIRDEVGAFNILNLYLNGRIVPGQLVPQGKVKYLRVVKVRKGYPQLTPHVVGQMTPASQIQKDAIARKPEVEIPLLGVA